MNWWRKPEIDPARYSVRKTYGGLGRLDHLDGKAWDEVPIPPKLHRCWPQTRLHRGGEWNERCACGGVRLDRRHPWIERNTRRPLTPEEEAQAEHDRACDLLMEQFKAAEAAGDRLHMAEILTRLKELIEPGQGG